MPYIRFFAPYNRITGVNNATIEAGSVRELCNKLIEMYGPGMEGILDEKGELSRKMVLMVNRRNAYTICGTDSELTEDMEIIIIPFISGG